MGIAVAGRRGEVGRGERPGGRRPRLDAARLLWEALRMKRRSATLNAMLFAALLVQWVLGMAF